MKTNSEERRLLLLNGSTYYVECLQTSAQQAGAVEFIGLAEFNFVFFISTLFNSILTLYKNMYDTWILILYIYINKLYLFCIKLDAILDDIF